MHGLKAEISHCEFDYYSGQDRCDRHGSVAWWGERLARPRPSDSTFIAHEIKCVEKNIRDR